MTKALRTHGAHSSAFFTVALANRGSDLLTRHVDALRCAVQTTKAAHPFHIRAMVILPDHLHAIWTLPKGDEDFATRWSTIKGSFSMTVEGSGAADHDLADRAGGLWQSGFKAYRINGEEEKRRLTQACWLDPVRHGLTKDPFDWPLSSIHRDAIRGVILDEAVTGVGQEIFGRHGEAPDRPAIPSCSPV